HATPPAQLYPLSLHDALPISRSEESESLAPLPPLASPSELSVLLVLPVASVLSTSPPGHVTRTVASTGSSALPESSYERNWARADRKSTRLNSSHVKISYAVF